MQSELNRLCIICTLHYFCKVHEFVQKSTRLFPCKSVRKSLWISFPLSNHLTTCFAMRERLASVFRLVISLEKGEFVFTMWNSVSFCGNLDISILQTQELEWRERHIHCFLGAGAQPALFQLWARPKVNCKQATLANDEKYLALLLSSPLGMMSLGILANSNLTVLPLTRWCTHYDRIACWSFR